jgi:hypothetical protein
MENTQTNWLSENYPKLRPYAGQYIAHDEPRLIASNYSILLLWAELKSLKVNSFSIYYVPKEFDSPQINMFKLLPVSKSEWKPVKPFRLRLGEHPPAVFDKFDIEFRQADREIEFKLREPLA